MDEEKHEEVELEEWWSLTEDRIRRIFASLDNDRDGRISYDELKESLRRYGIYGRDVDGLVARLDADNSQDLDFPEFLDAVREMMVEMVLQSASSRRELLDITEYSESECRSRRVVGSDKARLAARESAPPWVKVCWVDVQGETALKCLAIEFGFHPIALEDALSPQQRPKVERYPSHIFFVVPHFQLCEQYRHSSTRGSSDALPCFQTHNVCLFLSLDFRRVVTFSSERTSWHHTVQDRLRKSYTKLREEDGQFLAYSILDALVDSVVPVVTAYRRALRKERARIRAADYGRDLHTLALLKSDVEKLAHISKPLNRVVNHIIDDDRILDDVVVYLRDVRDNLVELEEDLDVLLEETAAIEMEIDTYFKTRQDKTVYALTVITAIFLPLQFLTGLFGMNFAHMPETQYRFSYYILLGVMVVYFAAVTLYLCFASQHVFPLAPADAAQLTVAASQHHVGAAHPLTPKHVSRLQEFRIGGYS